MTYKVAFVSLGCAKNLVNTEQMMALVRSAGHEITAQPEGADAAVLNTCGFIESAKTEAIENILEACAYKQQNPDYDPWEEPWENSSSPVDLGLTKDADKGDADEAEAAPEAA